MNFRLIGLVFKCQKWQTSAWLFSLGFFGQLFMVKSNNKVFKIQNYLNKKKKIQFLIKQKIDLCSTSQKCTGIILLELSSEGLLI